jgi:hypothetical protein
MSDRPPNPQPDFLAPEPEIPGFMEPEQPADGDFLPYSEEEVSRETAEPVRHAKPDIPPERFAAVAQLWNSPAIGQFINRRVEQLIRYGHLPDGDVQLPLDELIRKALPYASDALDIARGQGGRDNLPYALAKLEKAGALLLAAHDRIRMELLKAGQSA